MSVDVIDLRRRLRQRLLGRLEPGQLVNAAVVSRLVSEIEPLLDATATAALVDAVMADVHGLGPLQPLLDDPFVTDVMVVGGRGVWIERNGRLRSTEIVLAESEVLHIIERIVSPLGLRIDRSSPIVDARLADGSRVNAIVPPLTIDGACLTIRRFGSRSIGLDEVASAPVAQLLADAVRAHRNVVVSGGTGAGKTTLLNAMAGFIGTEERIVTIEDAAELRLPITHVVRLESRPANSEGVGRVTLRELVRNALRMRPDRIIVGEVRGPEALDMLQAMNTGHEGSMSTCHANSPIDALRRLETMVLMGAVDLPLAAVRQHIMGSVDLVVQISRTSSAARRVVDVSEVVDDGYELKVRQLADERNVTGDVRRPARRILASGVS